MAVSIDRETGDGQIAKSHCDSRDSDSKSWASKVPATSGMFNATTTILLLLLVLSVRPVQAEQPQHEIIIPSMTTTLIRQAEIPARDAGIIRHTPVKPGDRVEEGQILAQLDDEHQIRAVKAAELNLEIAKLNAENTLPLEVARALVREAELGKSILEITARIADEQAKSDIAVRLAEKTRETARFELDRARKSREAFSSSVSNAELNRLQVLFDLRTLEIEKAEEDRIITKLKPDADKAAVEEQVEKVQRSRLVVSEKLQDQRVSGVNLEVAQNELALARLHLERRQLTAPFGATIVAVNRQPGEWVEPGTTVMRLIQTNRLRVEGFVSADQATHLKEGMEATILFPDSPLKPMAGEIAFVSPEIDPVNQQVRITGEFDNVDGLIRPGLLATMKVAVSQPTGTTADVEPALRNSK